MNREPGRSSGWTSTLLTFCPGTRADLRPKKEKENGEDGKKRKDRERR